TRHQSPLGRPASATANRFGGRLPRKEAWKKEDPGAATRHTPVQPSPFVRLVCLVPEGPLRAYTGPQLRVSGAEVCEHRGARQEVAHEDRPPPERAQQRLTNGRRRTHRPPGGSQAAVPPPANRRSRRRRRYISLVPSVGSRP